MLPTLHAITDTETDSVTPRRKIRGRFRANGAALTVVPDGHKRTKQPLDGGILGPIPRSLHRRIPREFETAPSVISRAIPAGSARAAHGDQVMARLRLILSELGMRADGQRNHINALAVLIAHTDYTTMTTRPGWEALQKGTGRVERSVARYIDHLIGWGLLGRVAGGRSAEFSPPDENGERHGDAAVYVLCVPHDLGVVPEPAVDVVDINVSPPALGRSLLLKKDLTPTRAREKAQKDAASPRQLDIGAANGASGALTPYRPEIRWNTHATTTRQVQRLAAATEIWHRSPVFRRMSHKDLASSLREAFLAGWTIADIENAFDRKPDGTRWPDSGAPDVSQEYTRQACARLRGWIRSRLDGWRTAQGELLRSPDQRKAAAAREAATRQAIARRRTLEEQAQRAELVGRQDSRAKIVALAQIRALRK